MNSAVIICSPIPTPNTFFSKDSKDGCDADADSAAPLRPKRA
jgi:hypothetical protein